jgi:DEAD/DEAH box helicase domain-containing protein
MLLTSDIITELRTHPLLSPNFTVWNHQNPLPGTFNDIRDIAGPNIQDTLNKLGIKQLYAHQVKALQMIEKGENVVLSTGTASGKTLCYQIPILEKYNNNGLSTALLLYPTKALTNDQLNSFNSLSAILGSNQNSKPFSAVYDGDSPSHLRQSIRKNVDILLTNPDMLNVALLPHHTSWSRFFQNLSYIVVDELHQYKGVFGSHFANIIRRLKRVLEFYGASPQFILTSATIGNPGELAEKIIEAPVKLIEKDESPKGDRHIVLYNPPLISPEFGIREGLLSSTIKLSSFFIEHGIQTIVFCRSRRFVEIVTKELKQKFPHAADRIRGYRSGYLRHERRDIETGLKNGSILLVAATNALELGVDIGGVDSVIIAGYPGSMASIKQMSGRAGRHQNTSIAMIIASMNPLDQYFARYPDSLFSKPIEHAFIDANNPLILIPHLRSSAFEIPFSSADHFGELNEEDLRQYWDYLVEEGSIQDKNGKYFWLADNYPSADLSIRSAATSNIILQTDDDGLRKTIGTIDFNSGLWMCHEGAIYLHDGEQYHVDTLDLESQTALLTRGEYSYTTEPIKTMDISVVSKKNEKEFQFFNVFYGEVEVESQVTGFKKIDGLTREVLSAEPLNLPVTSLLTCGFWVVLNKTCLQKLRDANMWFADPNNYGLNWESVRNAILERDAHTCQSCGAQPRIEPLHVHHKIPFRSFNSPILANEPVNLVTLCQNCHHLAELNVKIRNSLSGLRYLFSNLAPLLVLCDANDIDSYSDPLAKFEDSQPVVLVHDTTPAGIGLSESLFRRFDLLIEKCNELVCSCTCESGCPSCVGPDSENGFGGKQETIFLLSLLKEY